MILALDTDVLVNWAMAGATFHRQVRRFVDATLDDGIQIGIAGQILHEFLHVVTDPRRFANPLEMPAAIGYAEQMWSRREVFRVVPAASVTARTLELLRAHRLGRKRILDAALAATLEGAEVRRLATFNGRDFAAFPFLEVVVPE